MRALIIGIILAVTPLQGQAENPKPAADAYVCIPDLATGFKYDKKAGKWRVVTFNVRGEKYLIKKYSAGKYLAHKFGGGIRSAECDYLTEGSGNFVCRNLIEEFEFNFFSLRFQHVWKIGWINSQADYEKNEKQEDIEYPHIEIGTCEPL